MDGLVEERWLRVNAFSRAGYSVELREAIVEAILATTTNVSVSVEEYMASHKVDTDDSPRWNTFFSVIRLPVAIVWLLLLVQGVFGVSVFGPEQLVLVSTLAELLQWMGHMHFPRASRKLPFFCPLQFSVWTHRVACIGTVALLCVSMVSPCVLGIAFVFLVTFCFMDLWRALYLNYWLIALAALVLDDQPIITLRLVLGFLYFWAGFWKVFSPLFYSDVAEWVFEPILQWIPNRWHHLVSLLGVVAEGAMGLVLLVYPNGWLMVCNVGMHLFIVFAIGYKNGIATFVGWNLFCMAGTGMVCRQSPAIVSLTWFHYAIIAVMNVFSLAQLWGLNEFPTLSHGYFVPQVVGGPRFLVFPTSKCDRFPLFENGDLVPIHQMQSPVFKQLSSSLGAEFMRDKAALSCEYVDRVYRLSQSDPFNEVRVGWHKKAYR